MITFHSHNPSCPTRQDQAQLNLTRPNKLHWLNIFHQNTLSVEATLEQATQSLAALSHQVLLANANIVLTIFKAQHVKIPGLESAAAFIKTTKPWFTVMINNQELPLLPQPL
jgi:hypothetical protein